MAYTPELRQDYKRNTETDCMGAWLAHDNENRITQTIFLDQQIGLPEGISQGGFFCTERRIKKCRNTGT